MGNWYDHIKTAVCDPFELCRILELPEHNAVAAKRACEDYPLLVPRPFLQKMEKGNPNDPLLLQILPQQQEMVLIEGFVKDPVAELAQSRVSSLLQKYHARTLLLTTTQCAVHCRYCFRRHHKAENHGQSKKNVNESENPRENLHAELRTVKTPEIILSGGDPLMLDDDELSQLLGQIKANPSICRIRLHTRLPLLIPARITDSLLAMLRYDSKTVYYVVLHINHPREIDKEFEEAIRPLVDQGTPVLVQSVLLRGVNDSFPVLEELYQRLISLRLIPYYLHQLDRVAGAAHFEVPPEHGLLLYEQLQKTLPGYAVPKYVRELPGCSHKISITVKPD